jgi:hypothetical protein
MQQRSFWPDLQLTQAAKDQNHNENLQNNEP